jgi:hypothetical protein
MGLFLRARLFRRPRAAELVPEQITPTQRAALMKRFVDELPATADGRGVN